MSDAVGKEACPTCRDKGADNAGDNLARYEDGGAYCFSCGYSEKGEGEPAPSTLHLKGGKKKTQLIPRDELEHLALKKRGITAVTTKFFDYCVATRNGKTVQVAHYVKDGKVGQKLRDSNKKFVWLGDTKGMGLFGQHIWRDGGKKVVITEGEIDAMTVSQLQQNKWPVVSIPNGAQGAAKDIAREIEWLEGYEQVIFMFDQDDPGREAAKECAEMLSPGKAFIARVPMKDANMCLMAGKGKEVIQAMWDAKAYRPDGIIDIAEVADAACMDVVTGRDWPWATLTEKTYGRRTGELYGFGGGTGCGKSTIFKLIAKHIIEEDDLPVGMIMLEEPPKLTAKTLAGMMMGVRVHVPGVQYDREELRKTVVALGGKVYLYDHFGSMSFDVIREKIRYMVRALGIRDIFLDHLTALSAGIDGDERKAIDKIMAELSSLTQELDCTIYFISHLTTPEGKSHEEGGRVLEKQFRGSRAIAYWSHFLFGIERDKQAEDDITTFRVLKDRYTGDAAGLRFGLRYDTDTGLLFESPLPAGKGGPDFTPDPDGEY